MAEDSTERLLGKLEEYMDSSKVQQTRIGVVLDRLDLKLDVVEEKTDGAHTKIKVLEAKISTVRYMAGLISATMGVFVGWFFKK